MNIINKDDIKKTIGEKSKYQKVMLLHDDTVSNLELLKIYEDIKEICIFNQLDISIETDIEAKVNDGYKALIFFCSVDKFTSLNIERRDFVNIYIPTDNNILPYYLNVDYELSNNNDYIIFNSSAVDVSALTSLYFNKFYNYLRNLLIMRPNTFEFDFSHEVTTNKILEWVNELGNNELIFADIELIKRCHIPYDKLPIVDYVLITALTLLIRAVKSHSLSMVDVYKSAGEDYALVDKFYAMYNNESLIGLINLNFYFLSTAVEKTRDKILEILSVSYRYDRQELNELFNKIKNYCKADTGILGYLYLYNIFSV